MLRTTQLPTLSETVKELTSYESKDGWAIGRPSCT